MTTNKDNAINNLINMFLGGGGDNPFAGLIDIGEILTPKGQLICALADDAEVDPSGNLKLKCGTILHYAAEGLKVADFIAAYANQNMADMIISVSHKDTILVAYASGLKGSPAFGVFTQNEKGKNVIEGPDVYPARPLKFVIACLALGEGERIVQAARTIREQFPDANIIGAYAIIDYEQGGMATLANANIPLQRLFTKSDIIAHQEIHKKAKALKEQKLAEAKADREPAEAVND